MHPLRAIAGRPREETLVRLNRAGKSIAPRALATGWLFLMAVVIAVNATAAPPCNVVPEQDDQRVATAAGCYIRQADRLLLVRSRFGGKFGFPGGFSNFGERAQCTAHRETWEETGVQVAVGKLARAFGNGFLLYYCYPLLVQNIDAGELPVPASGKAEIAQVLWRDPRAVSHYQWRFAWQVPEVLRLFDQDSD